MLRVRILSIAMSLRVQSAARLYQRILNRYNLIVTECIFLRVTGFYLRG